MPHSSKVNQANATPKNCVVLTVAEIAERWGVTSQHVTNLIEEGQLAAIDVAARHDSFPMPKAALPKLAARLQVTPDQLLEFIRTLKPDKSRRAMWRIPQEGYAAFMVNRNSQTHP